MATRANSPMAGKKERLRAILEGYESLAVAFSGGVDSTLLLAAARDVLGDRVLALTAESPVHARRETRDAVAIAQALGVRHVRVASREMASPEFVANPPDRCYICKKLFLAEIIRMAGEMGIRRVAHGANLDDLKDYRPGLRAAEELGVAAPLVHAGLTKADIRALSRRMRLPTWNQPSMACLATRIPYGCPITLEALRMVAAAEEVLQRLGFGGCRVRHHGSVARIEVASGDVQKILRAAVRAEVLKRLKALGFRHVALDLEGYVQGSLNRALGK